MAKQKKIKGKRRVIYVDEEVAKELWRRRDIGELYNDVIRKLLGLPKVE